MKKLIVIGLLLFIAQHAVSAFQARTIIASFSSMISAHHKALNQ